MASVTSPGRLDGKRNGKSGRLDGIPGSFAGKRAARISAVAGSDSGNPWQSTSGASPGGGDDVA